MTLFLLVLSLLAPTASAKDLPAGSLPLTQVGAVAELKECEAHVLANPWTAGNTVKVLIGQAEAQRICSEAKGNLAIADAKAKAIIAQADAEAGLIFSASIPMMNGESVSYVRGADGAVHLVTGQAADWHEYGTAVVSADPRLRYGGVGYIGGGDPNLYRLAGGQMGNVVAPALPGGVSAATATADCGTLAECDELAKRQAKYIAEQAKAK